MTPTKWLLYGALLLLYVLHNDLWYWNDPSLVGGLPIGLVYHVLFMAAASIVMYMLVRLDWPSHLEVEAETDE